MARKLVAGLVAALLITTGFKSQAQQLKANGTSIVNEKGENVLLRGMGLGGWMLQEGYMLKVHGAGQQHKIKERISELVGSSKTEQFYAAWLANHTRRIDIDSMKRWGFNSVRLPMHFNLFTLPVEDEPVPGKNTWLREGFALTDSLLSWCKANGMYLVLDLHAAPGGQGNDLNISDRNDTRPSLWESEANQQKTIALWKQLATRYANEPWIAGYDIINEPNWGFTDAAKDKNGTKEMENVPLLKLMVEITRAIREVDKQHIIIIEGNGWGNNYNGIMPPWDDNMVLSYHKYWNFNNQASIQHMLDTRTKYNIPVWLGETGENSNVWFTEAIRLLEGNNIGWCWWPLKKMGANNPIEIPSNADYDKVLAYWSGKGEKPGATAAFNGLMTLANQAKLENAILHKDVIDAMFRQPFTSAVKPFAAHVFDGTCTMAAVDYDLGRNGEAYYDLDTADYHVSGVKSAGNKGGVYRNDGVDIQRDSLHANKYFVFDMQPTEWLQYTVQVKRPGNYKLRLRLATNDRDCSIFVVRNNEKILQHVKLPSTGGMQQWKWIAIGSCSFTPGTHTIRLINESGNINLQTLEWKME